MQPVVTIESLVKCYGSFRALDGLDLELREGEVHGFLGPNGAGKSTTIRVLLGLLRADSGTVRLLDGDPWRDASRLHRRLAYVPGDVNLWPNLTGLEAINLIAGLRGRIDRKRRDDLIARFELDPAKKGRAYSKGNRQKVALVAALCGDVDLLMLDEPTSGLDPLMEATFQSCVEDATARGVSVLLSSHILDEVERLCDRVSIVRAGRTVETGTLEDLRHLTRTTVIAETRRPATHIATLPGTHRVEVAGQRVSLDVDAPHLGVTIEALGRLGIVSLTSHPPTLEDLFLRHYGNDDVAVAA
ncbi:MAG TPA: ABC transporter ATP-binding protein [Nocardioidaceae bacterium]|nr:ABC transporter ATP-binding protein [Nocardioidaceae bacterium]